MAVTWTPAAEFEDIRYELSGDGIAKITIDRPERRNAFRPQTVIELTRAFELAREDTSVGVIILCGEGPLGRHAPDERQQADIVQGFAIVRALGALDVGQAAAVCEGLALAVEAAEGTDAMIARIGTLREALRGTAGHRRGVLVKALKPTQDALTDMPVIGVSTVRGAASVHLAGIALEAGASLILDKAAVAAEADKLGLFVTGIKP